MTLLALLAASFLIGSSLFLQEWRTTIKSRTSSKSDPIQSRTVELAALERLKTIPMGENLVRTLALSFLLDLLFILAGSKDNHKTWMISNFGGIPPLPAKLAALEHLKTRPISLLAL